MYIVGEIQGTWEIKGLLGETKMELIANSYAHLESLLNLLCDTAI